MHVRRAALASLVLSGLMASHPALAAAPTVTPYKRPGINQLVSLTAASGQSDGNSFDAHTSADGRYVAFFSDAADLVSGDTNGHGDVFVRDTVAGTTQRVSIAGDGTQANGSSMMPAISADGRYVTFVSYATNLTAEIDTTNTNTEVYVHDLQTGTTGRITHAVDGRPSAGASLQPTISGDGRYVSFYSFATDLVVNDTNGIADVFVFDRDAGKMDRVTIAQDGSQANATSTYSQVSDDGSIVVFRSAATNLVAGDENGVQDIFVRDLATNTTELVSVATDGTQGNDDSFSPNIGIASDGRYIVFQSSASSLVPNDMNGLMDSRFGSDIFVRDIKEKTTERVSLTSSGEEFVDAFAGSISDDGRYVAFHATRSDQDPGDFGALADVYVHDRMTLSTELVSATSKFAAPVTGDSENADITGDGRYVYFQTSAPDFVPGDGNESTDIVRRVRGPERGLLSARIENVEGGTRLSGVATFAGEVLAAASDPAGDVGPGRIGADLLDASVTYRHEDADLLFRLALDSIPHVSTGAANVGGVPPLVYGFSFTLNGQRFEIRAQRASATAASAPAFTRYVCSTACVSGGVALEGGFGTAGDEIRMSLPAPLMGLQPDESLTSIVAFVGPGEMTTGVPVPVDSITLNAVKIPDARVHLGRGAETGEGVTYEVGVYPFTGRFSETLEGGLSEGRSFWARVCLDDRCGAPERIGAPS